MKVDDCYQLGKVIKTHGLKGELIIKLDVDVPPDYQDLESVFILKDEKLIPFFISQIKIQKDTARVSLEEVDTIEKAAEIVKCDAYLPLSMLPELPEGEYYFHDLVGCTVYEEDKALGPVKEVMDLSGNELICIVYEGKEVLIPIQDEIFRKVSISQKRIDVNLPNGLLEI